MLAFRFPLRSGASRLLRSPRTQNAAHWTQTTSLMTLDLFGTMNKGDAVPVNVGTAIGVIIRVLAV